MNKITLASLNGLEVLIKEFQFQIFLFKHFPTVWWKTVVFTFPTQLSWMKTLNKKPKYRQEKSKLKTHYFQLIYN